MLGVFREASFDLSNMLWVRIFVLVVVNVNVLALSNGRLFDVAMGVCHCRSQLILSEEGCGAMVERVRTVGSFVLFYCVERKETVAAGRLYSRASAFAPVF